MSTRHTSASHRRAVRSSLPRGTKGWLVMTKRATAAPAMVTALTKIRSGSGDLPEVFIRHPEVGSAGAGNAHQKFLTGKRFTLDARTARCSQSATINGINP